jgi:hypothetical protein
VKTKFENILPEVNDVITKMADIATVWPNNAEISRMVHPIMTNCTIIFILKSWSTHFAKQLGEKIWIVCQGFHTLPGNIAPAWTLKKFLVTAFTLKPIFGISPIPPGVFWRSLFHLEGGRYRYPTPLLSRELLTAVWNQLFSAIRHYCEVWFHM